MSLILIGERINGSFKDVGQAIQDRDPSVIREWAERQTKAGAHYLDVNMGAASRDADDFAWLVETVCAATDLPLSIDCNKLDHFKKGLETYREVAGDRPVLLNSTTAEEKKLEPMLQLALDYDAALIGLVMDDRGSPQDVDRRVELGAQIFSVVLEAGLPPEKLFLDPIVMPLKFMQEQAKHVLDAIGQLTMLSDPPPHISIGLSNMGSKATERKRINRLFLTMAMTVGLDTAIVDVCDEELIAAVATAEILLGHEIYSDDYLKVFKQKV